jgi:hypothetical protein
MVSPEGGGVLSLASSLQQAMNAHREVMTLTRRPTAERPRPKLQYRVRAEEDRLSGGGGEAFFNRFY